MDREIDNETREQLLKAMQEAKNYSMKLQEESEKRLWKKVSLPCSLYDALSSLSKYDMDRIRKNYNFKNLSTLKKQELAAELTARIPYGFKNVLYSLDQGRYELIRHIVDNSGSVADTGISLCNAEAFIRYSVIFAGMHEGEKVLYMPNELMDVFVTEDGVELKNIIRRNTEWIQLAQGMLYYYGVMGIRDFIKKMEVLTGESIDVSEFVNVISLACGFYGQMDCTMYGYKDTRVFDAEKVSDEQKMRADINYYPFTKKQLLRAGVPGYVDKTPAMNNFINFLLRYYDLPDEEINEIIEQITNIINLDSKPTSIINFLQSRLEFSTFEFVQMLTAMITELYNNTRQWVLKGHTPDELFREERKLLMPLPPISFIEAQRKKEEGTRKKIGRNDPCPCGSGKKYKKCCGR